VPSETAVVGDVTPSHGRGAVAVQPRFAVPVIDEEPNSVGRSLAAIAGRAHPVRTFVAGVVLSFVAIAGLSILLGILVTHVIVATGGVNSADERLVNVLSRHRSGWLTDMSLLGSIIAGGVVLPIVAAVWAMVAALFRQWRLAAFIPVALAIESGAYRATTLAVHRDRPPVHRLEALPANASYPSGHTAASIAVYCGVALLLTSRISNAGARVAVWALAAAIPVYVAFARMYRGMHHPLDVLGGVLIGIAVLAALVLVSRAVGVASAEHRTSVKEGG
jgi:membrane-associated phospholipid phosphatase